MKIFLLFVLSYFGYAQSITVTFEILTPPVHSDSSVYIAGGHTQLGFWNPAGLQLERIADTLWKAAVNFEQRIGGYVEFKITRGSWNAEAIYNANGELPGNFDLPLDSNSVFTVKVLRWRDTGGKGSTKGQITGKVMYHKNLLWQGLSPRDVIVWLPPGYSETGERYPVLYMHDGQNVFDPNTASFGVDWQIDEAADSLIRQGAIPPMVIVGINNTAQRFAEYTPGDTANVYMGFVVNKVMPLIESTYHVLTTRESRSVGGSSAGGLISFMFLWEYNHLFSKALCMSPSFKIDRVDYVYRVRQSNEKKNISKLYMDNGGIGLEKILQPGIDYMLQTIQSLGYKEGEEYFWQLFEEDAHNEIAWAKRIPNALLWLYGDKK